MIVKEYITPNHATTTYHQVRKVSNDFVNNYTELVVSSFISEASYTAKAGVTWTSQLNVPAGTLSGLNLADCENWLTTYAGSPLVGGSIVLDPNGTLADAQAKQITLISAACSNQIMNGFDSSALGSVYHYPAKDQDQANLVASVLDSTLPNNAADWSTPFWCEDGTGVWAYIPHNAAQIQQVGRDGKLSILTSLSKNQAKATQVMAATTIDAVLAIEWNDTVAPVNTVVVNPTLDPTTP